MSAMRTVFRIQEMVRKAAYKCFREVVLKKSLKSCGGGVHIAQCCDIKGIENISIGAGSSIGPGSVLWTTRANILIDEKVITGPHITIITGNHRTNIPGKFMADVTAAEKEPSDDEDVIIKRDVWIGANATILKGVTIEEGCVIAAGAVVTRSTEPFGIYAGVPASRIAERFDKETLVKHKELMQE